MRHRKLSLTLSLMWSVALMPEFYKLNCVVLTGITQFLDVRIKSIKILLKFNIC